MNPTENVNLLNVNVAVRLRPISTVNTGSSSSRAVSSSRPLSSNRYSAASTSRSSKSRKEHRVFSIVNALDDGHICLRNPKGHNSSRQEQKTFKFDENDKIHQNLIDFQTFRA